LAVIAAIISHGWIDGKVRLFNHCCGGVADVCWVGSLIIQSRRLQKEWCSLVWQIIRFRLFHFFSCSSCWFRSSLFVGTWTTTRFTFQISCAWFWLLYHIIFKFNLWFLDWWNHNWFHYRFENRFENRFDYRFNNWFDYWLDHWLNQWFNHRFDYWFNCWFDYWFLSYLLALLNHRLDEVCSLLLLCFNFLLFWYLII